MRFRQADVLVVAVPLVASIAAAGAEQGKEIAHEVVVEIVDVAPVEGVVDGSVVVDAADHFVGDVSGGADRSLEIVNQRAIGWRRNQLQNFERGRIEEAPHVGWVGKHARAGAADV